jgi:uncharacterized protein (TIGR03032 family)
MQAAAPFSSVFTPQIPELLHELKVSIVITTYQAGKVITISPSEDKEKLITLPRTFDKPMGLAMNGDQLAIATKNEVIQLENNKDLATHYPNKKNTYDSLFVPRVTNYTGNVDLHDIAYSKKGILAINTSFSCLCLIGGKHNFQPIWKPSFITDLVSEDRCHLNGLVVEDGDPKYVTALGTTDTHQGWRNNITDGGVLIDINTNEILLKGLAMPHSPTLYNGDLYMLLSATGEFVKVDIDRKSYTVIKQMDGFCRGLTIHNDYAFIGMSKLRKNSSTFAKLPFAETANQCGIKIVHIPTQALVGEIMYQSSVDEIYEVEILQNTIRPNILNTINPIHKYSLSIPGKTFWANPNDDVFK